MLPYCTLNRSTVLTSWVTGRMQWELDASCDFVQEASARGESVTAGISGHTDVLFRILACLDVPRQPEIAALACVLLLVGCDHHSVYEVRYTAKFHGVPFDECKSSSEWLQDLLYQAESKSADAAPQPQPAPRRLRDAAGQLSRVRAPRVTGTTRHPEAQSTCPRYTWQIAYRPRVLPC